MNFETIKILHVEDDPVDRKSLERLVKKNHLLFDLTSVGSIRDARDLIESNRFDVVLVDNQLGDGSGIDLISEGYDTPAIIVTGGGNEATAVSALRAGAYDYVIKDQQSAYVRILPEVIFNVIKRKKTEEERDQLINDLQSALTTIKDLRGLIPVCSGCKKVREDEGYWTDVDTYLKHHSDSQISHGLCPDCYQNAVESLDETG